ncbi:hypothetical protein F6V30_07950 [Oryzomonas sagensis]|uniref:Helix-turn-helix domain-containing protein n=1 Tax=Oryzomonas sagensis TaxID=2603857 RepID=A0ABQ6TNW4_9BACT|nr:hypothetical protein [Oryzomonas sagensis]KAB0670087.1 hypothetical protein F6V30_07950 [Oryzomonas sagensis]
MRTITYEPKSCYSLEEAVEVMKNYVTVEWLKALEKQGRGIPYFYKGRMIKTIKAEDLFEWIRENFPQE